MEVGVWGPERMDGWMDGWLMGGWVMDGWMDGCRDASGWKRW
jgi:hypothetical protein